MKWINGFGRPLLVLAAILPGVAWGAPGGLGPGGRREIRTAPAPSADALKVSLLGGKDPLILEVRGEGAARYQMTVGPEGRVSFHFPGAKLLPAGGIQDDRFLRQALQSPGSLVLPGSPSHLLGLEARPSYLRIEIKAVRAPEEARISQYRIGIGDKIRINIYGDEEFNDKGIRVVGNGRISVPYLGEIKAAGLTSKELADELGKRLAEGYLVDPKVSVEVQEYMSQWVHVSGEV
ncbi:MAG: polysaccharide biosynthesis/export family protein, partial [Acidobacteriota bacterium]